VSEKSLLNRSFVAGASVRSIRFRRFVLSIPIVWALTSLAVSTPSLAAPGHHGGGTKVAAACDRAAVLDLDATSRLGATAPGGQHLARLWLPGPGLLSLDAVAVGGEPVVSLLGPCDGGRPLPPSAVVERTAASVLIRVEEAGSHLFRLAPHDRGGSLPELQLHAAFLPGLVGRSGEDEEEIEIEADPLSDGAPITTVVPASTRRRLCSSGDVDDHGETFRCATPLRSGTAVAGEIRDGWGDDVDLFRLVVPGSPRSDLRRVEVAGTPDEVAGTPVGNPVDLVVELLDGAGNRLAWSGSAGVGASIRLARVLPAGVYFVRLSGGSWSEGPYRLAASFSAP